ncbi:hypothetical protein C8A01DRAFT_18363 [Parachaetomium inaequale]|uniref:BRCT domain-containing protein n=1 Tax=Parachaetomium inaequale TaxID=2588326 RepID=A0AAN6SPN4_9PEZI|nr:hypothetical protein C8A01DRAFT_18363 [Parachaetomium inaequale]
MRARKEKPIFRGLTIAAAGDLGGSAQWTDANISRWVGLREGKFVRAMGEDVTHVVCSGEEFKRKEGFVKLALKRPKTCQIVTLDWLEDSMLKQKRLDEEPYSHLRALKRERERERKRLMVIKGLEKAVKEVNPNLYHLYRDHTFFQYEVVMTRDDEGAGIQGERYVMSIFESNNAKPRLYWFIARFFKKKGDTLAKIHRPSHAPGVFAREFDLFEKFFQKKTGVPWAQRLVRAGTTDNSCFQYQPPTGGKPVGWVPAEYIPAEAPDVVMTDGVVSTTATTQPAVTAADTNDSETANTTAIPVAKPSHTPAPHPQPQPFLTPAPSPRADLAITTATTAAPSQGRDENHSFAGLSSTAAPTFTWPTPGTTPTMIDLTSTDTPVCAL